MLAGEEISGRRHVEEAECQRRVDEGKIVERIPLPEGISAGRVESRDFALVETRTECHQLPLRKDQGHREGCRRGGPLPDEAAIARSKSGNASRAAEEVGGGREDLGLRSDQGAWAMVGKRFFAGPNRLTGEKIEAGQPPVVQQNVQARAP